MSKRKNKVGLFGLFVISAAVVAAISIGTAVATQRYVNVEPELGSSSTINDSSASGGKAVVFQQNSTSTSSRFIDNPAGLDYSCGGVDTETITKAQLEARNGGNPFRDDCFTQQTSTYDNGDHVAGNFRLICTVSHFAYDDPIIKPQQPGQSHMHMFWGNTLADAYTNFNSGDPKNLLDSGGSSCQGGPLNRSSYWAPAMLAGHGSDQKIVMPEVITLYYKSHVPQSAQVLPQGIQLLVGNVNPGGTVNQSFTAGERLNWGCYDPYLGIAVEQSNTIPGTNGTPQCSGGKDIQAAIQFPQCIAKNSNGSPTLSNPDFVSHTKMLFNFGGNYGEQNSPCPASHPYRVPQITYLIRWANPDGLGESNWRLSSDSGSMTQAAVANPGGSIHGDWLGGWNEDTIATWNQACITQTRNCSIGQTGTDRILGRMSGTNFDSNQIKYSGPQYLDF